MTSSDARVLSRQEWGLLQEIAVAYPDLGALERDLSELHQRRARDGQGGLLNGLDDLLRLRAEGVLDELDIRRLVGIDDCQDDAEPYRWHRLGWALTWRLALVCGAGMLGLLTPTLIAGLAVVSGAVLGLVAARAGAWRSSTWAGTIWRSGTAALLMLGAATTVLVLLPLLIAVTLVLLSLSLGVLDAFWAVMAMAPQEAEWAHPRERRHAASDLAA